VAWVAKQGAGGGRAMTEVWPGESYPFGATWDGRGTNFCVFSEIADKVELCLFDTDGRETRIALPEMTAFRWHGYVPGVGPGQRYGFRVHGRFEPRAGHRANPHKLLIDPYARAIEGAVRWGPEVLDHVAGASDGAPDTRDSAAFVPRSVVIDTRFDWGIDPAPRTPWEDTVIYELHVKGFTARHPAVPPALRGTFAGIAHPAAIEHLTQLGVTAVELMPVHAIVSERALVERGLTNFWGYNSIGYFAPHAPYASRDGPGHEVTEFKAMVRALHAAGIEVILDVVYNHTAEGGRDGPSLCFRGLDNAAYYRLAPDDPTRYVDYTGCGNTLNMRHPQVLQLIMDSLRYWVTEMHVDGFRFDLAAALARELHAVDRLSAFLDLIEQDPVVSRVKLIAEPWDVGEGGYQVGSFPALWSEWNGKYRDIVRDFWRGRDATLGEFALRFTGSSDLYASGGRKPHASVNFVTSHDGFTLRDLVSYDHKRNGDNGEDNRDGENHNRSWNCGVEGESDDVGVRTLRARQQRNFLATLFLSQGVPMLCAGDEFGRTQRGNNNAYCQDNAVSWLDWDHADGGLLVFARRLLQLRRAHAALRRRHWFEGRSPRSPHLGDIGWFRSDGQEMREEDWNAGASRSLGVFLNGASPDGRSPGDAHTHDARAEQPLPAANRSLYVMLHAGDATARFTLPACGLSHWRELVDTAKSDAPSASAAFASGATFDVAAWSLRIFEGVAGARTEGGA
jgi:glycogen operon protein